MKFLINIYLFILILTDRKSENGVRTTQNEANKDVSMRNPRNNSKEIERKR